MSKLGVLGKEMLIPSGFPLGWARVQPRQEAKFLMRQTWKVCLLLAATAGMLMAADEPAVKAAAESPSVGVSSVCPVGGSICEASSFSGIVPSLSRHRDIGRSFVFQAVNGLDKRSRIYPISGSSGSRCRSATG